MPMISPSRCRLTPYSVFGNPRRAASAVSPDAWGQEGLRRRAAAGDPPVPRNAGKNRTASKRALLKAIEELGGKW